MTTPAKPQPLPPDRSHLPTEHRNSNTGNLHTLSVSELVDTIQREDEAVFTAMRRATPAISAFIEAVEPRFLNGGRLIYVGAGTSGRLGVLDASEAPPTFQVPHDRIIGIIAGGDRSLRYSSEAKEDVRDGAREELAGLDLNESDTLLGIASGGTTPYVHGALEFVKHRAGNTGGAGGVTGLITCAPIEHCEYIDHLILLETGPEVLTGSTRMKAGTATKLALNTISTTLMVRAGRVYENLMVDMRATNQKMYDRAARILAALTGLTREGAFTLLQSADGRLKAAVLMHRLDVDLTQAADLLARHDDRLDRALSERS